MASNESPLGANPVVAVALAGALEGVQHYPDPLANAVRDRLAARLGVPADQILVGNGSDELIYLLTAAYAAGGGHVVVADPPYQIDAIAAMAAGARITRVPLRDWVHDLEAMSEFDADLVHVCNPHNPTGTARSRADVESFVQRSRAGLVVVDEAYVDFADDPAAFSVLPLAAAGRVALLRTFSKVHGLAGLRIGYLVAAREVIELLRALRAPFSVGVLAQVAAAAALSDDAYQARLRAHVLEYRPRVARLFAERGYQVLPSQANFVLVGSADETGLVDTLAAGGVSVRPGSDLGVPGFVRVSVPSEAGFRLLQRALA
jgi:histidinol-phosphate aminotransferase